MSELVGRVGMEAQEGAFGSEGLQGYGRSHIIERVDGCTEESSKGIMKTLPPLIHTLEEHEHDSMQWR